MLGARRPSKPLEIADPRAATQRLRRRYPRRTHAAYRFAKDRTIQDAALPFQRQAFLSRRHLCPKHILDVFRRLGIEGVIVNRKRDEVIEEGKYGIVIFSIDDQCLSRCAQISNGI